MRKDGFTEAEIEMAVVALENPDVVVTIHPRRT
jgi:hypothetical protein